MPDAPPRDTLKITIRHEGGNTVIVFDDPSVHLQVPSPGDTTRMVVATGKRLVTVDDQTPRNFRVEIKAYRADSEGPPRRSNPWLGVGHPINIGTSHDCLTYHGLPEGVTSFVLLESDGHSATLRLQKAWCGLHESSVTWPGGTKPRRLDDIPMIFEANPANADLAIARLENLVEGTKLALALTGVNLSVEIKR